MGLSNQWAVVLDRVTRTVYNNQVESFLPKTIKLCGYLSNPLEQMTRLSFREFQDGFNKSSDGLIWAVEVGKSK